MHRGVPLLGEELRGVIVSYVGGADQSWTARQTLDGDRLDAVGVG